ncbi:hypothetical protein SLS56_001594 [Neofusicoccum ribis]|uniref:AB hydrolase-1 domain-containing protein n=1 Tax=Neofusicoccum ribis TaxID=45134 RepID=A0ABR3T7L9_9PEZI
MLGKAVATSLALASLASATKQCVVQTVPVDIEARNAVFDNSTTPHSNIDATWFVQNMTRQGHNFTNEVVQGFSTVKGTYQISTQLCWDDKTTADNATLQVLTHGIGFDKTYWDLSFENYNYSYVDAALAAGFATFSYDRLGIGASDHGDPLNEIQTNLEIAALRALTDKLRNGALPGVDAAYDTIVHVGHSYGSVQSFVFAHRYPNETQGIVLTGFSTNSSFMGFFAAGANFEEANLNEPLRFLDLPDGYLVSADASSNQYNVNRLHALRPSQPVQEHREEGINADYELSAKQFLLPPYFDPEILAFSEYSKQPVTVGELLTIGSAISGPSVFTGPVLVFTGDADVPFCGGDCLETGGAAPSIPAQTSVLFPNASVFEAYIQPNTGHGLTAHYNATAGYQVIQNWLDDHVAAQ